MILCDGQKVGRVARSIRARIGVGSALCSTGERIVGRIKAAGLFAHGKGTEKEELVMQNRTADAATEVVQDLLVLAFSKSIVDPGVRIQPAVAKILIGRSMELVVAAARDEIDLGGSLPKTGIQA